MSEWWETPPGGGIALAEPRRSAERAQLVALATRRQPAWRGRSLGLAVAGLALAGGTAAGVQFLGEDRATRIKEVHCHTTLEVGDGRDFVGTASALTLPNGRIANGRDAIQACADIWSQGLIRIGESELAAPHELPVRRQPVPPLLACVTADGYAAVFPTDEITCASLGLAELA